MFALAPVILLESFGLTRECFVKIKIGEQLLGHAGTLVEVGFTRRLNGNGARGGRGVKDDHTGGSGSTDTSAGEEFSFSVALERHARKVAILHRRPCRRRSDRQTQGIREGVIMSLIDLAVAVVLVRVCVHVTQFPASMSGPLKLWRLLRSVRFHMFGRNIWACCAGVFVRT